MNSTFGEQLKSKREEQGLSIEQVSHVLHIRPRYLAALESNDWSVIPSEVQAKGFLRLYADFLKLSLIPNPAVVVEEKPQESENILSNQPVESSTLELDTGNDINRSDGLQSDEIRSYTSPEEFQIEEPVQTEIESPAWKEIFQEIGVSLFNQRELLGISTADAEKHIIIRKHYLDLIESGNFDALPSAVQARGMLKNYARFLEMDEEAVLLRYAEALQIRHAEKMQQTEKPKQLFTLPKFKSAPDAPAWRKFLTPDLVIMGSIIISLFVFTVWGLARVTAAQSGEIEPTAPPVAEVLAITPSIEFEFAVTATPQRDVLNDERQQANGDLVSDLATPTLPVLDDKPLQLYIVVQQRAWMRVISDGKEQFAGRVTPGNVYSYSGTERLELLTGNGAGLRVYYNQTDLGTLGNTAEIVSLLFTNEGIVTPTPAMSPTPTATPQPTATLQPTPTVPTPTVTPFIP